VIQIRERLIKEIQTLSPEEIVNIYELVLDIKRKRGKLAKKEEPSYLKVQEILKKCKGSFSEDIRQMREDRI